MNNILHKIIDHIGKIINKKIIIIPNNNISSLTAAKSKYGFWYCGDVYNTADISYGIMRNGLVEEHETNLVLKIFKQLSEDFYMLDIGANTGYYGILASYLFPKSNVYSFEPIKKHCDIINESVKINNIKNLHINQIALGDKEEVNVDIYNAGSGTSLIKGFTKSDEGITKVNIQTLDSLSDNNQINKIDFIKIDVEGFELQVLKGGEKTINKNKPVLFVEICHTKDGDGKLFINNNFKQTIEFIESMGYKTYILEGENLNEFNKESTPNKGVWMFLFISNESKINVK